MGDAIGRVDCWLVNASGSSVGRERWPRLLRWINAMDMRGWAIADDNTAEAYGSKVRCNCGGCRTSREIDTEIPTRGGRRCRFKKAKSNLIYHHREGRHDTVTYRQEGTERQSALSFKADNRTGREGERS